MSTLITIRVQRSWKTKDDDAYSRRITESLIMEIEEAIGRSKYMIELHNAKRASFSRLYVALWQSTNQRLAATLADVDVLTLLHRIYYRFDLVNFNCESGRPESGGAFAKEYLPEVEQNLSKLKEVVEKG